MQVTFEIPFQIIINRQKRLLLPSYNAHEEEQFSHNGSKLTESK